MSQDRLPPLPAAELSAAQQAAAEAFAATRDGRPPFGPYVPLLRSPETMLRVAALGKHLRYDSAMPRRLNEFAILLTAREWSQQYEWHHHRRHALEAGLEPKLIAAVAEGRRPDGMSADEALVYDFCLELHRRRAVSDATYAKALARFGAQALVDLVGVNGFYSMLAMVLNVARTALPEGAAPELALFPG